MPKLATTLTDVAVRNYKPKEKPFKVAAGRGLHLLVKPDGSKFWVFRYRFEGVENSLSLLELFNLLEKQLNINLNVVKTPFRKSDQKVFIADTRNNQSHRIIHLLSYDFTLQATKTFNFA